jgi:hypothetical protein
VQRKLQFAIIEEEVRPKRAELRHKKSGKPKAREERQKKKQTRKRRH